MSFLERVCEALNQSGARYVIVGGYAVSLHGAVRGTLDIDVALRWTKNDLLKAEDALQKIGLVSRLPVTALDVFEYRDEYIRNRNLIAWNFHNPVDPSELLDIIINFDAKGKKAVYKQLSTTSVPVLNIRDLIDMKKSSGRPQDIEDIKALEKLK
jgi:hypothetical protein